MAVPLSLWRFANLFTQYGKVLSELDHEYDDGSSRTHASGKLHCCHADGSEGYWPDARWSRGNMLPAGASSDVLKYSGP